MSPGTKRIVAGLAVGGPIAIGALAWWWWLPAAVRASAEAALEERTGMEASVGDASLGIMSVSIEHVELTDGAAGVDVRIDEVELDSGPLGLALFGTSAIDAIVVTGVRANLDLSTEEHEEGLRDLIGRLRGDADDASEADGPSRTVEAREVTFSIDDATGRLASVDGARVALVQDGIELDAARAAVGADGSDQMELRALSLRLSRDDDGMHVRSAEVEGGELTWASRAEPLSASASTPLRSAGDGATGAEAEPSAEEPPHPEGSEITRDLSTFGRLGRLAQALRRQGRGEEDADEAAAAVSDGDPGWLRRLAPDATFSAAGLTVSSIGDAGKSEVMRDLTVSVARRDDGSSFRAEGRGATEAGGTLRWDVTLSPLELRGDGSVAFSNVPLAMVMPFLPDVPWHHPEDARLDGDLVVNSDSVDRLSVRGSVSVRNAGLSSPRIASTPIRDIGFTLSGEGAWLPASRRLEIDSSELTMGRATARLRGSMEWQPDRYAFDLTATLPPTACNDAVSAIPTDVLADTAGFSWRGTIGARIRLVIDSADLDGTELDLDVADACEFHTVPAVADLSRVEGPFLHQVLEPDGSWFEMTTGPGTGAWSSIYAVSPFMVHAVLAQEDASFFRHGGFAPWAIRDALVRNLQEGRFVYGASTITMQLAKNLFLHREKTLARKVQEVLLTWWLESALEKRDILELYLNVIEYGPNIYGLRHAAWHYFGRDPAELSPAESVFLAVILPGPKLYHHMYESGELTSNMASKMRRRLRHMASRGRIDDAALEYGLAEVDRFRFVREGETAPPRTILGETAPLPFSSGVGVWAEWDEGWGEDDEYESDGWGDGGGADVEPYAPIEGG